MSTLKWTNWRTENYTCWLQLCVMITRLEVWVVEMNGKKNLMHYWVSVSEFKFNVGRVQKTNPKREYTRNTRESLTFRWCFNDWGARQWRRFSLTNTWSQSAWSTYLDLSPSYVAVHVVHSKLIVFFFSLTATIFLFNFL